MGRIDFPKMPPRLQQIYDQIFDSYETKPITMLEQQYAWQKFIVEAYNEMYATLEPIAFEIQTNFTTQLSGLKPIPSSNHRATEMYGYSFSESGTLQLAGEESGVGVNFKTSVFKSSIDVNDYKNARTIVNIAVSLERELTITDITETGISQFIPKSRFVTVVYDYKNRKTSILDGGKLIHSFNWNKMSFVEEVFIKDTLNPTNEIGYGTLKEEVQMYVE